MAKQAKDPIVIICSEADCNQCHRKHIIDYLRNPDLFAGQALRGKKIDTGHLQ